MVNEFWLPQRHREVQAASTVLGCPLFPLSHELGESFFLTSVDRKEMNMIRHDYVSSNYPPVQGLAGSPYFNRDRMIILVRQAIGSPVGTHSDEVNRRRNPDIVESVQMIVLRHVRGSGIRTSVDHIGARL
jgi:hypothetical protein